ncbi:hypothetical protein BCD64_28725 [Nostoc sp. MBR 210]|nr:hypothetical protein BCD64_28725 [Nostoc sp. MBR 210]
MKSKKKDELNISRTSPEIAETLVPLWFVFPFFFLLPFGFATCFKPGNPSNAVAHLLPFDFCLISIEEVF